MIPWKATQSLGPVSVWFLHAGWDLLHWRHSLSRGGAKGVGDWRASELPTSPLGVRKQKTTLLLWWATHYHLFPGCWPARCTLSSSEARRGPAISFACGSCTLCYGSLLVRNRRFFLNRGKQENTHSVVTIMNVLKTRENEENQSGFRAFSDRLLYVFGFCFLVRWGNRTLKPCEKYTRIVSDWEGQSSSIEKEGIIGH